MIATCGFLSPWNVPVILVISEIPAARFMKTLRVRQEVQKGAASRENRALQLDKPRELGDIGRMPRYTLETIVIVLVILWLLGWLVWPLGNLVHLLLVVILVVVLIRLLQGRSPLP